MAGNNIVDFAEEMGKRGTGQKQLPANQHPHFYPHECFTPIILDFRKLNVYFLADVVKREGGGNEVQISICTLGPHPRQVATLLIKKEQWERFKVAGDLQSDPRPNSYDVEDLF